MEPGFQKDALRPPHIKYITHHIRATFPSSVNAHSIWEMHPPTLPPPTPFESTSPLTEENHGGLALKLW